jgi:hypothetical protein
MFADKTQLRKDGFQHLLSGMNSGRAPTILDASECAFAKDVTFRGGYPSNRQYFTPISLTDGGASGGAPGGLATFQAGFFQGAAIYDIDDQDQYIVAMVGGTLYELTVTGGAIKVAGVWNDGQNNPVAPQCWFCQADVYMVVQDNVAPPIIMQGLQTIHRSGTTGVTNECPVAGPMAYGQGRLFIAQGRQIQAGDILGGGTSVVQFTEQTYLSSATYFGVPLNSGNVVAMTFVEQGDTATGQGELFILARNSAYTINASVPREAVSGVTPGWSGTPGMQRVALTNIGGTGQRNVVNCNMDVFFRSKDGWRTFQTARNEKYGWGSAPISHEVNRILPFDPLSMLDFASSCLFKNRMLLACQPVPYLNGAAMFQGMIALDMDVISSVINKSNLAYEFSPYFSQRGSPAYDGQWSIPAGYRLLQVISGVFGRAERCFLFMRNTTTNHTEIWELIDPVAESEYFDNIKGISTPVVSQIETKAFDFKLPDALKKLRRADVYFTSVFSTITVTLEWRADGYPAWNMWNTITKQGDVTPCTIDTAACQVPGCLMPGYWFPIKFTSPPATCDPNTSKLLRNGYWFQLRITWSGPATLIMCILHCEEQVEDPNGDPC